MTQTSQGPYTHVNSYKLPINGDMYGICTLVSRHGVVAWMPDTDQQHVNPQYSGIEIRKPVKFDDVNERDIGRMIQQVLVFQTKQTIPLEDIVGGYKPIITKVLSDFRSHQPLKS